MVKYDSNDFLVLKISYINEKVRKIFKSFDY